MNTNDPKPIDTKPDEPARGGFIKRTGTTSFAPALAMGAFRSEAEAADSPESYVTIVPDDGMVEVVGDLVQSKIGSDGEKHFVSPKKSGEISADYVYFKAVGVAEDTFQAKYQWVAVTGGEVVPTNVLKYRVKRDAAGKVVVKIISKNAGSVVDRINVWIIWATGAKAGETAIASAQVANVPTDNQAGNPLSFFGPGVQISGRYNFKFTILPPTITTPGPDIPDLNKPNTHEGVTIDPPGGNQDHILGGKLKNGANYRWDMSRRMRAKVLNPNLIPKGDLLAAVNGETVYANQPKLEDEPAVFPGDDCLGNDDRSLTDEDNNPYQASTRTNLNHAIGEVASTDAPLLLMRHTSGVDGNTFEIRFHFGEFLRVLIGRKWYRCSDFLNFRAHYKIKRQLGAWVDDTSDMAMNNNGY